jgi:hypothetical protein
MKKLNLIVSNDDLRPALKYIQVINGHCYATNCHALVKIPNNEVFGSDIILPNEEIYFSGEQWKKQNFFKAVRIIRDNNIFKAYDRKGLLIGMLECINGVEFRDKVGRFPDCEQVIPTSELDNINKISFSHKYYFDIIDCFNLETPLFHMEFRGQTKCIIIKPNVQEHTEGFGLLMPLFLG